MVTVVFVMEVFVTGGDDLKYWSLLTVLTKITVLVTTFVITKIKIFCSVSTYFSISEANILL